MHGGRGRRRAGSPRSRDRRGPGWVDAVAIRDGRVVAAGSLADVEAAAGAGARRLALAPDEVAIPGLTDAHLHLAEAALARRRVALEGAASIPELVARVREAATRVPGDAWIEGAGWDADLLGRWPTAADLEAAAPGRRVALWAHDHHSLLASSRAIAEAGVGAGTPDPDGGVIRRDAAGPTGRPARVGRAPGQRARPAARTPTPWRTRWRRSCASCSPWASSPPTTRAA